jgi:hypothetical protein
MLSIRTLTVHHLLFFMRVRNEIGEANSQQKRWKHNMLVQIKERTGIIQDVDMQMR